MTGTNTVVNSEMPMKLTTHAKPVVYRGASDDGQK